jgi:hypothetical protein
MNRSGWPPWTGARTQVVLVSDFSDTFADKDVLDYLKSKEENEVMRSHVRKIGVLGIVGVKRIIFNTWNTLTGRKARAFDKEEDALEFLVP